MDPRYPLAEIDDVPADIRDTILAVQQKSGFVPNVFLMLARRPAEFRAFFAYHDAIMLREESHLSKGDRELVVTSISGVNRCTYCVVAHGALLRIYEKQPLLADQVAVNHRTADIDARQRAILDFAHAVNTRSHEVEQADIDALAAHGLDAEDAWDIMAITAFFGLSNRVASVTGMMPNAEFYLMGRVPRTR
ncbi:MAG: peroxidase-related enzyme [Actinomycetota bacterium]|nr:peroxidase-related enzyme [Actinomycetota bacterium]